MAKYRLTGNAATFGQPLSYEGKIVVLRPEHFRARSVVPLLVCHAFKEWIIDVVATREHDHLSVRGTLDSTNELQSRAVHHILSGWRALSVRLDGAAGLVEISLCPEGLDKTTWVRLERLD